MLTVGKVYTNKKKTIYGMKYPAHDITGKCVCCAKTGEKMYHKEGVSHVAEGTDWGGYLEVEGRKHLYWVDSNDNVVEAE